MSKQNTIVVRWSATYETKVEVDFDPTKPENAQKMRDVAADIDIEGIENTEYVSDTWEVEAFEDLEGNELSY